MKQVKTILTIQLLSAFLITNFLFAGDHPHHLAFFVGSTSNLHAHHTDFTVGGDYEYRLPFADNKFGIGAIGDFVFAEHTESLFMGALTFHPTGSFKIYVANGIAITEHEVQVSADSHYDPYHSAELETESVKHHVLRVGSGYDIHLGIVSLTPTFNWDLIEGHSSLSYGIAIGIGF